MLDNISNLGDMIIHWNTEDQPVTRDVRKQMELDGTIMKLVKILEYSGENLIDEKQQHKKSSGEMREYLCRVTRIPKRVRVDHKYMCHIKDELTGTYDAIGDIYLEPFPESIRDMLTEE